MRAFIIVGLLLLLTVQAPDAEAASKKTKRVTIKQGQTVVITGKNCNVSIGLFGDGESSAVAVCGR